MNPHSAPLQSFIDDELARAPLLMDQVLQTLLDAPLKFDPTATSSQRHAVIDRHERLGRARAAVVKAFAASLREQVLGIAREQAAARGGPLSKLPDDLSLALVDEDEVAADVEVQRAIVVLGSSTEYELRELRSFTSALAGDMNVAHDTNPFRPDAYARALLAAVRALPAPGAEQLAVMRQAVTPLAEGLRKAYAAACTRLEDQGVEPGAFRTIVLPPGVTGPARAAPAAPRADLHALRDSMPVPLDDLPEPVPARAPRAGASARVDQQVIELLTRLFDAIVRDRQLGAPVQALIARLQSSAVRVALRDPSLLQNYEHPVWVFLDRLAFLAARHREEPAGADRFLRYAQGLVENMTGEPVQDAALYRWAAERLVAFEEHSLLQRCQQVQGQIDALRTQSLGGPGSPGTPSPAAQALDVGQLETVPAELMDLSPAPPPASPARECLPAIGPGDWLTLFLQGQWRELQLLWTDGPRRMWLFRQPGGRTWALQGSAVQRLHDAGLAEPLEPESLVQHAAQQVMRHLPPASR